MIKKIFVEKSVRHMPSAQRIIAAFGGAEVVEIPKIEEVFGSVHKPYLHKRSSPFIFIGEKRGVLVKDAGETYGHYRGKHYYFIHAYNCPYECHYCYLQGYFHSPDLVFFVNHEEIVMEMENVLARHPGEDVWFHGGEFSDNLVFSNITREWDVYWNFFRLHPTSRLELRTKSVNTKFIETLDPLPNAFVSFTLSPGQSIKQFEYKTPSLEARLSAMERLSKQGFWLGVHLDPIIDTPDVVADYAALADELFARVDKNRIAYISMGIVRFSKGSFDAMKRNYPESPILLEDFQGHAQTKVSYSDPKRLWILKRIAELLLERGYNQDGLYVCMEGG